MGNNKTGNAELYVEPGEMSRMIRLCRAHENLPKLNLKDPDAVRQRVKEYFDFCQENDVRPGMVMLGNWLGVNRQTIIRWKRGETRSPEYSEIVEEAINTLESLWENYLINCKGNPAGLIFLGKIMFGNRETNELIITPTNPIGDKANVAEIGNRYVESLPDEDDN